MAIMALSERAAVIRRQLLLEIDLGFSFLGRNICRRCHHVLLVIIVIVLIIVIWQ